MPAFMREVGDVHRELYAEQAELYGENIRGKIERCIAVSNGEYEDAVRARAEHAEQALAAFEGYDLLVTPTLSIDPPPADVDELDDPCGADALHVPVQRPGLAGARAPGGALVGPDHRSAGGRRSRAGGRARAGTSSNVGAVRADLEFAHRLADAADAITMARFRSLDLRVETKPDLTPVSEADRAAEEALRALVGASGRGEGVLGEEFGDDGGDAKWIVDPIDGTSNYVRGVPVWATLLALQREGEVVAGLVSAPALGRRWWAIRGRGSVRERRAVPGLRRRPDRGQLGLDDVGASHARRLAARIVQRAWSNRGLGDFWQHCLVAEGSLDVACDSRLKLWDYAAVQLLVEEAGGRCTTYEGGPPAVDASFVATNGHLHDEVVSLLAP